MNPDLVQAIPEMVRSGVLKEDRVAGLLRIARGELISVHVEIRLLFYLGVLLTASGAGLLIKDNYQHIGPFAIALAVGLGALISFVLAARHAPHFSWEEMPSPSIGYDYLLLLGVLLGAADLAFIEVQFTPLGANWPWHLLITSVLMLCIAVRYDSRTIFSLALSTFAAWRGLSVSLIENPIWHASGDALRWNALCCGLLFVLLGHYLVRAHKKPHFEPIAVYLGWLLVLGALISGGMEERFKGNAYILLLVATGFFLAWHYFRIRHFGAFAYGVMAVFIGVFLMVTRMHLDFVLAAFLIGCAAIAMIAFLWNIHRKMKELR